MQIQPLLKKFGRDLIYLGIIGGLVCWIAMDKTRQKSWNNLITNDLKWSHQILQDDNSIRKMNEIDQFASDNPSPQNEDYKKRAHLAQKLTSVLFKQKVEEICRNILPIDPSGHATRTLTPIEIQSLSNAAHALADSLCVLADHDPMHSKMINNVLIGEEIPYWEQGRQVDLGRLPAFTHDMLFRAEMALVTVLAYCREKISPGIICDWGFMPSISAERSSIRPGETYRAEIYLSEYTRKIQTIAFKVNGNNLAIKDGIAKFSKRYTTPGEKKYKVEMEIKDLRTGKTDTYAKEFALMVVDSCN